MQNNHVDNRWRQRFQTLTRPAAQIADEEARQRATLTATLSLLFLGGALLITIFWIIGNPDYNAAPVISLGLIASLLAIYALSRTPAYCVAAYLLVLLAPATVATILVTAPGPLTVRMLPLNFLVLAILFAGILLSVRATIIISVLITASIALFFFIPNVPFPVTYAYLTFMTFTSILFIVATKMKDIHEQGLRASRHRYQALFEQTNDAIFILDLEGRHLEINQHAAKMLGYSVEELSDLSFRQLVIPREIPESELILAKLLGGERLPIYERTFRKKDGTEFAVEVNVFLVRDNQGRPMHIQSVIRDISERKQAEDALRASEARLRLLVNQVPALLWTTDTELQFTSSMGLGLGGLGLKPGQVLGATLFDYFQTDDEQFLPIAAHRKALAEKSQQYEMLWNGNIYQTLVDPLYDMDGQVVGTIGLALDITEQFQAREALLESQKLESLGFMAEGIAHKFNDMLTTILTQISVISLKLGDDHAVSRHLGQLSNEVKRAANLTEQILAYSGRGTMELQTCQLNHIIIEHKQMFQKVLPNNIAFGVNLATDLPFVNCDPGQIQQLIINLLINAGEAYDSRPGTVNLLTTPFILRGDEDHFWRYTGRPLSPGQYVLLSVEDDGPGIPAWLQDRLFEPFLTTHETGRGLGLAVVLGIVRGHLGGISVHSKPGRGTIIQVLLPAVDE